VIFAMRYLIVFFLFVVAPFWDVHASYRIEVEGLNNSQLQKLDSLAPNYSTKKFSLREMDDLIRKIYASGEFSTVSILKAEGSKYKIVAEVIKRINAIIVTGENNLSERRIINAISIKRGQVLDRQRVLEAANQIKKLYEANGHFSAKISAEIQLIENSRADVEFTVIEGPVANIVQITIDTENLHLKKELERVVKSHLGEPVNQSEIADIETALGRYFSEHRYLRSRATAQNIQYANDRTEAYLTYKVKEAEKFEIVFEGAEKIPALELYRRLNLTEMDRSSTDPTPALIDKIRNIYLEQGFAHVQVNQKPHPTKDPYLRYIVLNISEGPKVRLRDIEVRGRLSRNSSYYEDFLLSNSGPTIGRGYYNREDLQVGYDNLFTELKNQGYLQPKFNSAKTTFSKDKSFVDIRVQMDEGPLSVIRRIRFSGNTIFEEKQLLEITGLTRGQPLNTEHIQEAINRIKEFYYDQGFLEMAFTKTDEEIVSYDAEKKQAVLNLDIYEGPKIYVKSILLEGNSFTKDYVILNSIPFEEGDLLTPEGLQEANARLVDLGIFNRISIEMLEKNSKIANRTIVISVSERLPGTLKFGPGINDEYGFTFRLYGGISYSNIAGTARAVSARADLNNHVVLIGKPTYKVTLGYLEPFILDNLTSGRINISFVEVIKDLPEGDSKIATIEQSNKIDFSLERELAKNLTFTWTLWSIDSLKSFKVNADPEADKEQVVIIGPSLEYDSRDNPFSPTKGFYARLGYDYSSPDLGSSDGIEFYRVTSSMTNYTTIGKANDIVWANNIQGGYVENLSGDSGSGVPESYTFRLGGRSTIRGFDASDDNESIVPEYEYDINPGPGVTGLPYVTTQSSYFLYKSEFRIPIYGNWASVLFYDAGAVYVHDETNPDPINTPVEQKKPFRQSAGLGFRYNTPFGPINFEWAWKIDGRNTYDKLVYDDDGNITGTDQNVKEAGFRFHFSLGTF
tara:strand:+ start:159894 stop:162794 length:2901 start_codon:yes stop_codon:yes gene_type:complete